MWGLLLAALLTAGELPNFAVADLVAPSVLDSTGSFQLSATGSLKYGTTRAVVSSPANGVLQITNAAGGGTVGTTRLILGANAATGGAALVLNNTAQRLGIMNGDATAYVALLVNQLLYSGSGPNGIGDISGNNSLMWQSGVVTLSGGGGSPATFTTWDATGNATFNQTVKVQNAATIRSGANTPEGAVTGAVGDIFLRTNGGAGTTMYVKESGAGNTGWVAK